MKSLEETLCEELKSYFVNDNFESWKKLISKYVENGYCGFDKTRIQIIIEIWAKVKNYVKETAPTSSKEYKEYLFNTYIKDLFDIHFSLFEDGFEDGFVDVASDYFKVEIFDDKDDDDIKVELSLFDYDKHTENKDDDIEVIFYPSSTGNSSEKIKAFNASLKEVMVKDNQSFEKVKFDPKKVYTAVNADEVKIGSKGYAAGNLSGLRDALAFGKSLDKLEKINPETYSERFNVDGYNYTLFYLVEEPTEEEYRPYENFDELVNDYKEKLWGKEHAKYSNSPLFMPTIWVAEKDFPNNKYAIEASIYMELDNVYEVRICDKFIELRELFEKYTYLDGSPLGVKKC